MARVLLGVNGMNKPEAVEEVRKTLIALEGIERVEARLDGQATVDYDAGDMTVTDILRALRKRGFVAGMV